MTKMVESYVDIEMRVKVKHPEDVDPADAICQDGFYIELDGGNTAELAITDQETKECVTVGRVDPESGALIPCEDEDD